MLLRDQIQKLVYLKKENEEENNINDNLKRDVDEMKSSKGSSRGGTEGKEGLREKIMNKNPSNSRLLNSTKQNEKKPTTSNNQNLSPLTSTKVSQSIKSNKENKCAAEKSREISSILGGNNFWNEEIESLRKSNPEQQAIGSKSKSSPANKKKIRIPFNFPKELNYSNYQQLAHILNQNE